MSRATILRVAVALLILLLLGAVWVGVRAVMAKNELQSAIPLAATIRTQIASADGQGAGDTFATLAPHAERARSLTSDPVWRAYEMIPLLGDNLTAVRKVSSIVDNLVQDAAEPLTRIMDQVHVADFKPVDGALDLAPLTVVQPQISTANVALTKAQRNVRAIDASRPIAPVKDALARLASVVGEATTSIDTLDRAVRLLPDMLGGTGPRNYRLLVQHPGELRSPGGVSGAMAILHTENGKITLAQQASSEEFKSTAEPVLQLLTRDVYERYADKNDQDAFFSAAAASVFEHVLSGQVDAVKLIAGFGRAGTEGRVLVWSTHAPEQTVLAGTTLAGELPQSDAQTARFGVYLNDATGGKMDTYLHVKVALGQGTCSATGRPSYRVGLTLTNAAPLDAGTTLSPRVTGDGRLGVTPGSVQTLVSVYGAPGMKDRGLTRGAVTVDHSQAMDAGYPVSVNLAPGESTELRFDYLGLVATREVLAVGTPIITSQTPGSLAFDCG